MIGRLQRIKDLRLDRAEQQLAAQQARVQLARVRQREAEQESLDYRQWRLAEEERLFAICQAEQLDRKGLKAWHQQVALLREKRPSLNKLPPSRPSGSPKSASACRSASRRYTEPASSNRNLPNYTVRSRPHSKPCVTTTKSRNRKSSASRSGCNES